MLSIWLLWVIGKFQSLSLFIKIIVSVLALHLMSFLAFPDTPLIFFMLVYLFYLKKYLASDNLKLVLPLSLSVALMVMTKYYGIFIPLITLVAVPSIFRRKSFWMIFLLTALLLIPHLIWQIRHDFVSLRFHLEFRNFGRPYHFDRTLNFLLVQPILLGPVIGIALIILSFIYRPADLFERVLKFIIIFFFGFFFLYTFRGEVMIHWTAPAFVPVILLAIKKIERKQGYGKGFRTFINASFVISIISFALIRAVLIYDFIPQKFISHEYLHGWRGWAKNIRRTAGSCPVIFYDNFGDASRYFFYEGNAHSLSTIGYRKTQYDVSEMHRSFFDKKVLLLFGGDSLMKPGNETEYDYRFHEHFSTFPEIKVVSPQMEYNVKKGSGMVTVPVKISRNPYTREELAISQTFLTYEVFDTAGDRIRYGESLKYISDIAGSNEWTFVTLKVPSENPDHCFIRFGISSGDLPPTLNSGNIRLNFR